MIIAVIISGIGLFITIIISSYKVGKLMGKILTQIGAFNAECITKRAECQPKFINLEHRVGAVEEKVDNVIATGILKRRQQ